MSCNLLGKLVIVKPLTQLKTEPNIIGNIFITKIYFNLKIVHYKYLKKFVLITIIPYKTDL